MGTGLLNSVLWHSMQLLLFSGLHRHCLVPSLLHPRYLFSLPLSSFLSVSFLWVNFVHSQPMEVLAKYSGKWSSGRLLDILKPCFGCCKQRLLGYNSKCAIDADLIPWLLLSREDPAFTSLPFQSDFMCKWSISSVTKSNEISEIFSIELVSFDWIFRSHCLQRNHFCWNREYLAHAISLFM